MTVDEDLTHQSTLELGELMARGELSPVELLDGVLARIARVNPALNAVVDVLEESARAQARESEARLARGDARPLEGLPVLIKDNVLVAGTVLTLGSRTAPTFPMPEDATVVARLRSAGMVIVGKTNLPEFGTIPSTESVRLGACHNPWNLEHTPGGSSGGSAAAVAAGIVPVAHGNDGGGSLRIPASCCGLFTIKPTRGRISNGPIDTDGFGLLHQGFISRTVRDNARCLDAVVGSTAGDAIWSPPPPRPFLEEVERPAGRLRVGWTARLPIAVDVHPACAAAAEDAARLLAELGHEVEEVTPDWQQDGLDGLFTTVWAALIGAGLELVALFGGDPSLAEPHNRALHELASRTSSLRFAVDFATLQGWARRAMGVLETHDVLLTPTMATPPPRLGTILAGVEDDPLGALAKATPMAAFTVAGNITGAPCVNLPLAEHEGLPVGVMVTGRPGDDALLLRLAAEVEAARPWARRRPALA